MTRLFTLSRVDNGFILTIPAENDEQGIDHYIAYELPNDPRAEREKSADLLYAILELMGYYNSKHEPYRIIIEVREKEAGE
jgi:hypothetical protein